MNHLFFFQFPLAAASLNCVLFCHERPYMDSPSFASTLLDGDEVRLLTYIRPLELAYVDAGP